MDVYEKLSKEQKEVFNLYKSNSPFGLEQCFADFLNQSLREGKELSDSWNEMAKQLDSLLCFVKEEKKLFRASFDDFVCPFIEGDQLIYPAYMSTTDCESALTRHYSNSYKMRIPVKLDIDCPAGAALINMEMNSSHGGHEKEYLLGRMSIFNIKERIEIISPNEINEIMSPFYGKDYNILYLYKLDLVVS